MEKYIGMKNAREISLMDTLTFENDFSDCNPIIIPAANAPKTTFIFKNPANAAKKKQIDKTYPAVDDLINKLTLRLLITLTNFGTISKLIPKNAPVRRTVKKISDNATTCELTKLVATARAIHKITSSTVAAVKIILAKRVCIIFKSINIFEITGI